VLQVSASLFSSQFTTQRPQTEPLSVPSLTPSVISGLCSFTGEGSPYIAPLESTSIERTPVVLARWWNRGVYLSVQSSTLTLYQLLYSTDAPYVSSLMDTILNQQRTQQWSIINDTHPLAQIHNMFVTWVLSRTLPSQLPTANTWLEMLFLYAVGKRVLEDIYATV
jgi:hypothetical protein